jgi:lysophospholipase L1-like esterase
MNNKKILLVGDSITASFNTRKLLPEFNIINKGLSGNKSAHLLRRLNRDLVASTPEMIIILIGTNDIAQGYTDEEILNYLHGILDICSENIHIKNIFIASVLPTRNNEPRPNERIRELNKKIQIIAEEFKVNYLDLYSLFVDGTGQLFSDLTNDGLHLNEKAYLKWAHFLRKLLKEKLAESS